MRNFLAAVCALVVGLNTVVVAQTEVRPEHTHTALLAIDEAKALAKAGRGQLLLVGSTLSTEQTPSENVLVVLDYPIIRDMKPGTVLIFLKNDCAPVESCLLARRVTDVGPNGSIETDPYTTEGLLFAKTKVTLLGSVSYAIDLETDSIRDMRQGHSAETITLSRAIAQEEERTRITSTRS